MWELPDPVEYIECEFCGEQAADYEIGEFYDPQAPEDDLSTKTGHQSCGLAKGWEVA